MEQNSNMLTGEFNPTFLYTWKGTRGREDEKYHHHDFPEAAFVLSGEGRYRIEGEVFDVKEGDFLILNPGDHHQALYRPDAEAPATEFYVAFSDIQLKNFAPNCMPLPDGCHVLHTTGDLRQRLFKLCSSMEAESAVCREGRYFMLKAYLTQMLLLVIREQCEPVEQVRGTAFESTSRKYVVERLLDYFEDHYNEKISLDMIAENMYLSPYYISRIFKSETGDTPIRYLIQLRLEKARELLEAGTCESIQEVAAAVGYEDAYHFSKLFKKHFGFSPSRAKRKG